MARLPRYFVPDQAQHVIQRGNNRQLVFAADDDYQFFLDCLKDAAERHGCATHAYVLMTNHVHLLTTAQNESSLPKMLQSVGRRYVQYFNYTYRRTGTLWEGRYRATLIDSDPYLLICSRYIELNPVRANLVRDPSEYPWSSYHGNAAGKEDLLLIPHPLYNALGRSLEERQAAYRGLFRVHLDEKTLAELREATNKAWVLGNGRFKEETQALAGRRVAPLPKGRPGCEGQSGNNHNSRV
jgi:putative transposase